MKVKKHRDAGSKTEQPFSQWRIEVRFQFEATSFRLRVQRSAGAPGNSPVPTRNEAVIEEKTRGSHNQPLTPYGHDSCR